MLIQSNKKLVFVGDSVTDAGRARPFGEGLSDAHGKGYVSLVAGFIDAVYPEKNIRVVNMGVSGDTSRDMAARWDRDVLDIKPDWVAVMIGVNDVWRQFDSRHVVEAQVPVEDYYVYLEKVIEKTMPRVEAMILMTPFFIEPNKQDLMMKRLMEYQAAVRELSAKYGTLFLDTQTAFDAYCQTRHSSALGWDRVHPNYIANVILARAFLNAIEFDWEKTV